MLEELRHEGKLSPGMIFFFLACFRYSLAKSKYQSEVDQVRIQEALPVNPKEAGYTVHSVYRRLHRNRYRNMKLVLCFKKSILDNAPISIPQFSSKIMLPS